MVDNWIRRSADVVHACREGHIDQCEEIRNHTEDGYKWGFFGFSNFLCKEFKWSL